jgi:hypothetical protein
MVDPLVPSRTRKGGESRMLGFSTGCSQDECGQFYEKVIVTAQQTAISWVGVMSCPSL